MAYQPKSYRKFVATAATATLVAGAIAPLASAASFTDVAPQYKEAVDFVVSKGAQGLSETKFGVNENIKRVDAAVLLVKVLGLDIEKAPDAGFTDVPERAVKYVNALKAAGITSGKSATKFGSDQLITRGELAVWIQKGFKLEGQSDVNFTDVPAQYTAAVGALVANEITKGKTATQFGTNDNAKRGDYAIFLMRADKADSPAVQGSVKAINNTTVEVTYKEAVSDIESLDFSIEGLKITNAAVKQTNNKVVVLTTEAQTADKEYTVKSGETTLGKFKGVSAVIPSKVDIVEKSVQGKLGQQVTLKAQVTVAEGASKAGIPVTLFVPGSADGIKAPVTVEAITDENGVATHTYTRYAATTDNVTVYATGDRSKFSTGYVFWGVDTTLTVEEVTTGATINNNANKTYKVTYKHPVTGKAVANKDLNVSFAENINVAPNEAKNATVNGVAARQLTNNTAPKTAVITTDSKGEATFTVSGANTEVTPVVFDLNDDKTHGKDYASYYEADLLQVKAAKVKFSALQAAYSIELTRDGGENAAFGYENGRKYKVLVKDKDGKVAKNEIVNIAFNEDLDRVISTNTKSKFVKLDADGKQVNFYGPTSDNGNTEDKITVKTNDKGEASFVIGSENGSTNDYATPVAWIDVNSSNAKDGQLDEGEPTKVGQISYFEAAKLTGGKLASVDSKGDEKEKFKGNESAKFQFQLTNQSGKKIAITNTEYDEISATYTVTNTGDNDVEVTATVNNETVTKTVSPNRDYTVTVDGSGTPSITVKAVDPEKSAAVKVTANAIVKDLATNGLKPFTISTTSETKASFTGTKEVGNLEKGIIESFDTDKKTFTIAGKNPVKYANVDGKTFVYRDLDNRPVSLENFEKELKAAGQANPAYAIEVTYEVKDNETTFYLKSATGIAPVDTVNAGEAVKAEAAKITSAPAIKDSKLELPLVAAGYTVAIKSSSQPAVINLKGEVTPQAAETTVDVVFTVSTVDGKYKADSKSIAVKVASKAAGDAQAKAEADAKKWAPYFDFQDMKKATAPNTWTDISYDGVRDLGALGLSGNLVAENGNVVYKVTGDITESNAAKLGKDLSLAVYIGDPSKPNHHNKVAKSFATLNKDGSFGAPETATYIFRDVKVTEAGTETITFTLDVSGVKIVK